MKKFLLATTGLVGAVLVSSTASAQTPKVTVGGFIDFQAGIASDDLDANQRALGFRNDSEVSIRVDGKSDMGLGYGAVIDLEADVTQDAGNEGLNASRTYAYLEGDRWGRFEMGSNQGAAETMKIGADYIARATGGIDGAWTYFANQPGSNFVVAPSLVTGHGSTLSLADEDTDNNNKVTYYTPKLSGVQLGLSYAPDFNDRGQSVTRLDNNMGAENIVDAALSYENQYGDVAVAASATGQIGDAELSGVEDLAAYNVGTAVSFAGFSVAGSYGDWADSLMVSGVDASYWTLGGAYDFQSFGASVTYFDSTLEAAGGDNEFTNLVFGADYKLAPGLTPYAEVSVFEFDAPAAANRNEGTAVILGTQLAF